MWRDLYYIRDKERQIALYNGMVSGDISIKKRTELLQASLKLAFAVVKTQVPEFVPPNVDPFHLLNPPPYLEALENVIARVIHNPLDYYDILRFMDLALMEYDLQEKEYNNAELEKLFPHVEGSLRGMKTILHFICQVTNIQQSTYKVLNRNVRPNSV